MTNKTDIVRGKRKIFAPFLMLMLFWVLLNGSIAADVLLVGVLTALLITLFFGRGLAPLAQFRYTPRAWIAAVQFLAYFFKVATIVLKPALPIKPGIVKGRTKLNSPMGRLLLANSITLTPGTLTIELDGEWLYIHWVTVESADIDAATQSIVAGFERYLEVMYG